LRVGSPDPANGQVSVFRSSLAQLASAVADDRPLVVMVIRSGRPLP
jgi:hypothetical protein